jgi:hypothetical protein
VPRALYDSWPEQTQTLLRCRVVDELEDRSETYVDFAY